MPPRVRITWGNLRDLFWLCLPELSQTLPGLMSGDRTDEALWAQPYAAVTLERWDADMSAVMMPAGRNARFGAFIEGAQLFDAAAFGIGPSEALYMDPQQRLLLEHAAQALQSRDVMHSLPFGEVESRISVMVGIGPAEYVSQTSELVPMGLHFATGGAISVASGRCADQQPGKQSGLMWR